MTNFGKKFEEKFKWDWKKSFPNTFLYRLPDQQSKYYGASSNPCDFIAFVDRQLFLIECKTHKGNTFPLQNLTQYERLISYKHLTFVNIGIILWMMEHENSIFYLPIETIEKMKNDGLKSFNVKKHDFQKYPCIHIPSIKKRTFYDSDYSILLKEINSGEK